MIIGGIFNPTMISLFCSFRIDSKRIKVAEGDVRSPSLPHLSSLASRTSRLHALPSTPPPIRERLEMPCERVPDAAFGLRVEIPVMAARFPQSFRNVAAVDEDL